MTNLYKLIFSIILIFILFSCTNKSEDQGREIESKEVNIDLLSLVGDPEFDAISEPIWPAGSKG